MMYNKISNVTFLEFDQTNIWMLIHEMKTNTHTPGIILSNNFNIYDLHKSWKMYVQDAKVYLWRADQDILYSQSFDYICDYQSFFSHLQKPNIIKVSNHQI